MLKKASSPDQSLHDILVNIPEEITFKELFGYSLKILDKIWHYPIIVTGENQYIALSNIIFALLLLFFGIKLAKSLSNLVKLKVLNIFDIERNVGQVVERITYYFLLFIIGMIVLDISNVPLKSFTFIGGALAIGLGFGSQQILNNFISGLIIMVEQPIRIGDIIEINNLSMSGTVTNIGARCTHILTGDNIDVIIPNSVLLQNTIVNLTLTESGKIRATGDYKISQANDTKLVEKLINQGVSQEQFVLKSPRPVVILSSITSDNSLIYKVQFWIDINGPKSKNAIISNLNHRIFELFKENGVILNTEIKKRFDEETGASKSSKDDEEGSSEEDDFEDFSDTASDDD